LRWDDAPPEGARFLGDHWERGYGDLEWRGLVGERVMPWYFLCHAQGLVTGWGVRTGAGAMCHWTVDARGVSLWLDLRNGTSGVRLGQRTLLAAEVVKGEWNASPYQAARAFCGLLCPKSRLPAAPVYGGNDWYHAYGHSTHESMVRDSAAVSDWAGSADNRPFSVVDGGWQLHGEAEGAPWITNDRFPDMAKLAREIKDTGCRPGIWIRPLLTREDVPEGWTFPERNVVDRIGRVLDPSVPEVLERVGADFRQMREWGYELVKHDFTTFDIFDKWGFEMGGRLTAGSWKFHDESRTTAEIVRDFYRFLRESAGSALLIGCNTIGHLGAGLFELQRTGDDTSGKNWERTRRMGVNTLAFRMPQQGTFFDADADCVGLTNQIPWEMNKQWLSLLAGSGTPLFVSAAPDAVGAEQKAALKEAFAMASRPLEPAEPLDWLETTCPQRWKINGKIVTYDWYGTSGASSFIG
jgi:alpha-galactosidase